MHIYPPERKTAVMRFLFPFIISAALLIFFICGFFTSAKAVRNEQLLMTERSVRSALINCYSIEGFYPQYLDYLEKNYSLAIDHDKYIVFYESLGSNNFPSINVVKKGGM